ncbi:DUF3108 domain-containing protein [Cognatilysobacter segetis]|uniref:DUF3108 domain-containing protein n=1 Tax=Cognatilysobacter segetis TaxID=2492394 RepID=UPI00105D662D|nr:DUF3108 domain-containing protein [Lysobacter segetis]
MRTFTRWGLAAALLWVAGLAQAVEPFRATYDVYRGGRALGVATLSVAPDGGRWRVDLVMDGKGLIGLAGLNAQQSTVFDEVNGAYRPIAQSTVRKVLFTRKQTTGIYDWSARKATWTGDVKKTRRSPVDLQPGDMSGLLINLAVIRDAQPGQTLQYRYVDSGRARVQQYVVSATPEDMSVGELRYSALRVDRVQSGAEQTSIWVADGVPTPIRILQRENGEDTYDLRLVEYKGA